jgi:hypothetical protein
MWRCPTGSSPAIGLRSLWEARATLGFFQRWRRAARTLGFSERFPSHDHGMVGFIKQLVDEQGAYDATRGTLHGEAERSSRFRKMTIVPSIVFVWKPGGTESL